jgi:hypothetical protein
MATKPKGSTFDEFRSESSVPIEPSDNYLKQLCNYDGDDEKSKPIKNFLCMTRESIGPGEVYGKK